jgi:glycerate dehydrogenase
MKIVFLDVKTMGEIPNLKLLEKYGEVTYFQTTLPEQTRERVQGAEVVVTNKVILNRDIIQEAKALKLICVAATGINNIDKEAAAERGIPVKNAVDYSTHSVAQLTFAVLLQLLNQVSYYDNYVKQGDYAQSDIFTHLARPFRELKGMRFGILGLGNIGRQVASIAQAFGAEVVYYSASGHSQDQPYQRLDLEPFLSTTDVISIHAPLTEKTADLINYERLQRLKPTAFLINVGRGGIVNEKDLAQSLNENLLAGAGIDVFTTEPIASDNPLLQVRQKEKLVLTPHIAWASLEARTLLMEKVGQNLQEFLQENRP